MDSAIFLPELPADLGDEACEGTTLSILKTVCQGQLQERCYKC